MATKIRGRQIETGDFIRTNTASNVDWTNDTETASQAAIAAKIASSGVKEITSDYKVWQLSEGLYHVDGSANMNYGGGYFRPYTNYYLFVLNYSGYSDRKRFMLFYETNSNLTIYYGESTSTSGTLTQKNLSSLKNMGGASSGAAGSAGFAPAPAAGDNTKYLRGDATWQAIPSMTGATSSVAGSAGLVPVPSAGNEGKFLRGNATWDDIIKIYHWSDTTPHVDASVTDIISDYNNGYSVFLEVDGHYRFPLYQVVEGDRHKWVIFGFTALYNSYTKVDCYNFRGEINDGVETWVRAEANTDDRFPGGNNFVGATSALPGKKGIVPAPAAGDEGKVLFGDGTWKNVGITLDGVAVGYTTAGYKYQFEYGGDRISYSEIVAIISNGIPVVATTNGPLWYLDRELINNSYEYVLKQVIVKNNQLQLRRLRHVVENNEDFWDEEIEFTTT